MQNENPEEKTIDENFTTEEPVSQDVNATSVEPKKEEIDYKSKYFYLAADFDNFRKRVEKEKQNLIKFGNENVLSDLIEVVDNFDRTIEMLQFDQDQKIKNIVQGLEMVKKQFMDTLTKSGLTMIDCLDKEFDPNFHEALSQEYVEGKQPNVVIREFQKGYILNGRVIRASKVVVACNKQ